MIKKIKKILYVLIYRNRFFIPLVVCICLAIAFLMFSLFSKIEAKNRLKSKEIYPVSVVFDVPAAAMDDALEAVVDNEKAQAKDLNFVNLISLLAARYDGNWNRYNNSDLKVFVSEFKRGVTEKELATPYENSYKAFKNFYETMFKESIGQFRISKKVDENNNPIFENRFGLKSYFPIAYDFDATFLDDYEKEDLHLSSIHHLGIDLNAKLRTPIVAVESGIIKECGQTRDFGWQVIVQSFDGFRNYYYSNCHKNHPFAEGIKPKAIVKAGQVVGYVGATSCCNQKAVRAKNWPHLHFGMSLNLKNGSKQTEIYINPYSFLKFLRHHQSVVIEKQGEFETKYDFEDPVYEENLKKLKSQN